MKTVLNSIAVLSVMAIPFVSMAATFQYVDVNGHVRSIVADDAYDALVMPDDIAAHSGVIQVTESTDLPDNMNVPL